jgi:hypothetical protein
VDKFDRIREAGIDGCNYDLYTDDIVERLQDWDERFGIEVLEVDAPSSITIRLQRLPDDLDAFAAEVEDFCPDIIWQGVGSQEELVEALREEPILALWWD